MPARSLYLLFQESNMYFKWMSTKRRGPFHVDTGEEVKMDDPYPL